MAGAVNEGWKKGDLMAGDSYSRRILVGLIFVAEGYQARENTKLRLSAPIINHGFKRLL